MTAPLDQTAAASEAAAKNRTLVTLLLDRSGSMHQFKADTIGAINAWIGTLRESATDDTDMRFSLVQFDGPYGGPMHLERTHVAQPIAEIPDLADADFQPRGGTPLIDAAIATILAIDESLSGREGVKVVLAIQTDGEENQSQAPWRDLKALVKEKTAAGWEIIFMGAGIDAYAQGAQMGIGRSKTLSYGTDSDQTRAAFAATAQNTSLYASGAMASMDYTDDQKIAAGDRGGAK